MDRKVQSNKQGCYQMNIPKAYAELLGITVGTKVNVTMKGKAIIVKRA